MNIVFGMPLPDFASSDTLKPMVLLPSGCTSWFSCDASTAPNQAATFQVQCCASQLLVDE